MLVNDILFFLALALFVAATIYNVRITKIKKQEFDKELNVFKHTNQSMHLHMLHSQSQIKETSRISADFKKELANLKSTHTFVKSAIREKVKKKKIRGKRR